MKQTLLLATPLAAAAALLVSCDNPADETTEAKVGEKKAPSTVETPDGAVKFVFTDRSTIEFTGSKVTGSHDGGFKVFTGHFFIQDGEPVGTEHLVSIDMDSIWTDTDKLTGHLKTEDFFAVATYPTTTFDNITIEKTGDSQYTVTGNLDIRGVTKSVSFPATVTMDGDTAKIEAEFDINRFHWGIEYKGSADDLIRKEIVLRLNLEATPE